MIGSSSHSFLVSGEHTSEDHERDQFVCREKCVDSRVASCTDLLEDKSKKRNALEKFKKEKGNVFYFSVHRPSGSVGVRKPVVPVPPRASLFTDTATDRRAKESENRSLMSSVPCFKKNSNNKGKKKTIRPLPITHFQSFSPSTGSRSPLSHSSPLPHHSSSASSSAPVSPLHRLSLIPLPPPRPPPLPSSALVSLSLPPSEALPSHCTPSPPLPFSALPHGPPTSLSSPVTTVKRVGGPCGKEKEKDATAASGNASILPVSPREAEKKKATMMPAEKRRRSGGRVGKEASTRRRTPQAAMPRGLSAMTNASTFSSISTGAVKRDRSGAGDNEKWERRNENTKKDKKDQPLVQRLVKREEVPVVCLSSSSIPTAEGGCLERSSMGIVAVHGAAPSLSQVADAAVRWCETEDPARLPLPITSTKGMAATPPRARRWQSVVSFLVDEKEECMDPTHASPSASMPLGTPATLAASSLPSSSPFAFAEDPATQPPSLLHVPGAMPFLSSSSSSAVFLPSVREANRTSTDARMTVADDEEMGQRGGSEVVFQEAPSPPFPRRTAPLTAPPPPPRLPFAPSASPFASFASPSPISSPLPPPPPQRGLHATCFSSPVTREAHLSPTPTTIAQGEQWPLHKDGGASSLLPSELGTVAPLIVHDEDLATPERVGMAQKGSEDDDHHHHHPPLPSPWKEASSAVVSFSPSISILQSGIPPPPPPPSTSPHPLFTVSTPPLPPSESPPRSLRDRIHSSSVAEPRHSSMLAVRRKHSFAGSRPLTRDRGGMEMRKERNVGGGGGGGGGVPPRRRRRLFPPFSSSSSAALPSTTTTARTCGSFSVLCFVMLFVRRITHVLRSHRRENARQASMPGAAFRIQCWYRRRRQCERLRRIRAGQFLALWIYFRVTRMDKCKAESAAFLQRIIRGARDRSVCHFFYHQQKRVRACRRMRYFVQCWEAKKALRAFRTAREERNLLLAHCRDRALALLREERAEWVGLAREGQRVLQCFPLATTQDWAEEVAMVTGYHPVWCATLPFSTAGMGRQCDSGEMEEKNGGGGGPFSKSLLLSPSAAMTTTVPQESDGGGPPKENANVWHAVGRIASGPFQDGTTFTTTTTMMGVPPSHTASGTDPYSFLHSPEDPFSVVQNTSLLLYCYDSGVISFSGVGRGSPVRLGSLSLPNASWREGMWEKSRHSLSLWDPVTKKGSGGGWSSTVSPPVLSHDMRPAEERTTGEAEVEEEAPFTEMAGRSSCMEGEEQAGGGGSVRGGETGKKMASPMEALETRRRLTYVHRPHGWRESVWSTSHALESGAGKKGSGTTMSPFVLSSSSCPSWVSMPATFTSLVYAELTFQKLFFRSYRKGKGMSKAVPVLQRLTPLQHHSYDFLHALFPLESCAYLDTIFPIAPYVSSFVHAVEQASSFLSHGGGEGEVGGRWWRTTSSSSNPSSHVRVSILGRPEESDIGSTTSMHQTNPPRSSTPLPLSHPHRSSSRSSRPHHHHAVESGMDSSSRMGPLGRVSHPSGSPILYGSFLHFSSPTSSNPFPLFFPVAKEGEEEAEEEGDGDGEKVAPFTVYHPIKDSKAGGCLVIVTDDRPLSPLSMHRASPVVGTHSPLPSTHAGVSQWRLQTAGLGSSRDDEGAVAMAKKSSPAHSSRQVVVVVGEGGEHLGRKNTPDTDRDLPFPPHAPPSSSSFRSTATAMPTSTEGKAVVLRLPLYADHTPSGNHSPTTVKTKKENSHTWRVSTSEMDLDDTSEVVVGAVVGKDQPETAGVVTGTPLLRSEGSRMTVKENARPQRQPAEGSSSRTGMGAVLEAFKDVLVRTESIERKELQRSLLAVRRLFFQPFDRLQRTLHLASTTVPPLFSDLLLDIGDAVSLQQAARLFAEEHQSRLAILHAYAQIPLHAGLRRPTVHPLAGQRTDGASSGSKDGVCLCGERTTQIEAEEASVPFHVFWMTEDDTKRMHAEEEEEEEEEAKRAKERSARGGGGEGGKEDFSSVMASMDRVAIAEKKKDSVIAIERDPSPRHRGSPPDPISSHPAEGMHDTSKAVQKKPKIRMTPVVRSGGAIRGDGPLPLSLWKCRLPAVDGKEPTTLLPPTMTSAFSSSSDGEEMKTLRLHGYHPHWFPPPPPPPLSRMAHFSASTHRIPSTEEGSPCVVPFTVLSSLPAETLPPPSSLGDTFLDATTPLPDISPPSSLYLCSTLRLPAERAMLSSAAPFFPQGSGGKVDNDTRGETESGAEMKEEVVEKHLRVVNVVSAKEGDVWDSGETAPWQDPPVLVIHRKGTRRIGGGKEEILVEGVSTGNERVASPPVTLPGWSGPLPSNATPRVEKRFSTWRRDSATDPAQPASTTATSEGRTAAGSPMTASLSDGESPEGHPKTVSRTNSSHKKEKNSRNCSSGGGQIRSRTRTELFKAPQRAEEIKAVANSEEGVLYTVAPSLFPCITNAAGRNSTDVVRSLFHHGEGGEGHPIADGDGKINTNNFNAEEGLDYLPSVHDSHSCSSSSSFSRAFDSVVSSTWSSIWQHESPPSSDVLPSSLSLPHHHQTHQSRVVTPPLRHTLLRQTEEKKTSEGTHWFHCTDSFFVPLFSSSESKRGEESHFLPSPS